MTLFLAHQVMLTRTLHNEIAQLPCLPRKKRLLYSQIPAQSLAMIQQFLLRHINDHHAGIKEAAQHIGISYITLIRWRQKLKINPNIDLHEEYMKLHMAMSPRLEEKILNEIETNFLQPGYYFNNHIMKMIAIAAFNSAPPEDKYRPTFVASDKWCKSFRKRHGYVWRRAHYKKRPYHTEKSEAYKMQFIECIGELYQELAANDQLYLLANADETSWKIAYVGELTWARKGSKEVRINTEFDPKACFTSIATVSADNTKYPICLIAKGKTDRCHRQFRNFEETFTGSKIFHTESGWMNSHAMCEYFLWLRNLYDRTYQGREGYEGLATTIHLILDCHTSHTKKATRDFAAQLNIKLYFVPAGYTDEMQPLDIKIFGALKAKARSAFFQLIYREKELRSDKGVAAHILGTCWNQLSNALLESAWELYSVAVQQELEQDNVVENFGDSYSPYSFHDDLNISLEMNRQGYIDNEEVPDNDCTYIHETNEEEDIEEEDIEEEEVHSFWETNDDMIDAIRESLNPYAISIDVEDEEEECDDEVISDDDHEQYQMAFDHEEDTAHPITYDENIPVSDVKFSEWEEEIKMIRSIASGKDLSSVSPSYGITNIGYTCYLNVFLQLLIMLPQGTKYLKQFSDDEGYKLLYSLIQALYEELMTTTQTIDLFQSISQFASLKRVDMQEIIDFINIQNGGSVATLIRDFLSNEIEVIQNYNPTKIVDINPRHSFGDNIQTVDAESIHEVLICERENYISNKKFEFPLSFHYKGVEMGLKMVITHPKEHFKCYKRIGTTNKFIEINDHEVTTNKKYPLSLSYIALYIKI